MPWRSTVVVLAGMGLRTVLQLGLFVAIARLLGVTQYGTFVAALAWVSVFTPLSGGGAITVLVRDASRAPDQLPAILARTLKITVSTSVLLIGLSVSTGSLVLPPVVQSSTILYLALAELLCAPVVEICARSYQSREAMLAYSACNVGLVASRVAGMICLWLITAEPLRAADWALTYLMSSVAASGTVLLMTMGRFGRPGEQRVAPYAIRDGLMYSVGTASARVHAEIDKTMLARFTNVSVVGAYSAAARLVDLLMIPVLALLEATASRFYRHGEAGPAWGLGKSTKMITASLCYVVIGGALLWIFSDKLVLLLGPSFAASPQILRVLVFLPLVAVVRQFMLMVAQGSGHQQLAAVMLSTGAAINVAINWIGIPHLGWIASFAASLTAEIFMASTLYVALRRGSRTQTR